MGGLAAGHGSGTPRSRRYRRRTDSEPAPPKPVPKQARTEDDRLQVLAMLKSDRFGDLAPRPVYATLRDEGRYLCAGRTLYRMLAARDPGHERRRGHQHRAYDHPALLTTWPNRLWRWDRTKRTGPVPWSSSYFYVLLDVCSRYGTGCMIAERESAELAGQVIETRCQRHGLAPDQLPLHSDRGAAMNATSLALLLSD